jgi:CRISPR/Cas system-associated exonuclease Cas4 (RecB family)
MKTFLEYVAEDILRKYGTDLSHITVVFPNKRASLFLNEHLARLAGKPIWSPAYTTISDLFRQHATRQVADPIKLVCDLHKSFTAQTGIDETLDHFYGWGQLLLNDFDDIDKQLADADRVLANLSDLHEMDDDSFLSDEQRQVLRRFFSTFSDDHTSELRQRFLRLWSHMADIYHDFNLRLEAQGLAYEGALYREVVAPTGEASEADFSGEVLSPFGGESGERLYLFVGFNVLLNVERRLFTLLKKEGKARFYWDFDHYYMKDHEAGHFISQYLADFPNELDIHDEHIYRCFSQPKRITIASASTENIQARYAAKWLKELTPAATEKDDTKAISRETAIVLCNEGLLPVIVHCLPDVVQQVNITTGYPLAQAPVASLINRLIALRRDGYDHSRNRFRPRQVKALLRHPYLLNPSMEMEDLLFRPFAPLYQNEELLIWLCDVIKAIALNSPSEGDSEGSSQHSPLTTESIFRAYTLLNRLLNLAQAGDLVTDITTLGRLITQLMQATTIPFHGEPAEGLQVMGILETRNLDFRHLLILSAQEGNMPRGQSDTSFIPYSLRKAYGLTTPEHKVAIYSYYFHRLLQRADDVTIVYNDSTSDGQKGEKSRFLLQLMVESPPPIRLLTLQGGQDIAQRQPQPVENRAQVPELLSPTAINRYLRCPLAFHYYYVENLREPDNTDEDTIDNRLFGNIFHEASRIIYVPFVKQKRQVHASDIDRLLKDRVDIERAVDQAIRESLPCPVEVGGGLLINRSVIIHYLRQLLQLDRQLTPFTILDLEGEVKMPLLSLPLQGDSKEVFIGGRIDRLDLIRDKDGHDLIRVIDYKTGAHRLKPLADVDAVFLQESLKEHSDYYLQTLLYALIVAREHPDTPVAPALLFIQHTGVEGYDPVLRFGKDAISDVTLHADRFLEQLRAVVTRMFDLQQPLTPTDDRQRCLSCPYRQLCFG